MKKLILTAIIALNIVNIPIGVCAEVKMNKAIEIMDVQVEDYESEYKKLVGILKRSINEVKPTGNPDIDYLNLIKPIHATITSLSSIVANSSKNPGLVDLSSDIAGEYQGELKEIEILLNELAKNNKSNPNKSDYFKDYKAITDRLISDLEKLKLEKNYELNYLTEIGILDSAMVSLSEVAGKHVQNDITKKIANNIVRIGKGQVDRIKKLIEEVI